MSSTIIVALETISGGRHLIFTMDLCLCNRNFKRGEALFLRPCVHRIHLKCWNAYAECKKGMPFPYCAEVVYQKENVKRKKYKKLSLEDRKRILKAAREETDWLDGDDPRDSSEHSWGVGPSRLGKSTTKGRPKTQDDSTSRGQPITMAGRRLTIMTTRQRQGWFTDKTSNRMWLR